MGSDFKESYITLSAREQSLENSGWFKKYMSR